VTTIRCSVHNRNAVIGSLVSRQDIPVQVEDPLAAQSVSSSCSSDLAPPSFAGQPSTAVSAAATDEAVDVSDVLVTLPVPSLSSTVEGNQTVSSLVGGPAT